jgi:hypothetical protein
MVLHSGTKRRVISSISSVPALGGNFKKLFLLWLKLSRSEQYVYWEDIPRTRRPNRSGEAWEQYYQRMRERSEDQRGRVVSSLPTYKR